MMMMMMNDGDDDNQALLFPPRRCLQYTEALSDPLWSMHAVYGEVPLTDLSLGKSQKTLCLISSPLLTNSLQPLNSTVMVVVLLSFINISLLPALLNLLAVCLLLMQSHCISLSSQGHPYSVHIIHA